MTEPNDTSRLIKLLTDVEAGTADIAVVREALAVLLRKELGSDAPPVVPKPVLKYGRGRYGQGVYG